MQRWVASSQPSETSTRGRPMGIYASAVALWFMAIALSSFSFQRGFRARLWSDLDAPIRRYRFLAPVDQARTIVSTA